MNRTTSALLSTIAATVAAISGAFAAPAEEPAIPQPDAPVLMIGDSMMRLLGHEMEKTFKKAGVQPAVAFSSLGSGLVRPSVFDWNAKVDELLTAHKPKTVFVAIGTNDRQAIEAEGIGTIRYENAAQWRDAYSKCIGGLMDRLVAGGVTRVVWMLLPDMNDTAVQEHAQLVNEIVREQAVVGNRGEAVTLLDLGAILSRRPGKFTRYLMSPDGRSLAVRDPDGVHLSVDGAKFVAQAILKRYWGK